MTGISGNKKPQRGVAGAWCLVAQFANELFAIGVNEHCCGCLRDGLYIATPHDT